MDPCPWKCPGVAHGHPGLPKYDQLTMGKVSSMTGQPVLIFDGDCGFCTTSVRFAQRRIGVRARVTAWQFADLAALGTTRERAEHEVLWIDRDRVYGGAQAVAKLLITAGPPWSPLG